jgi:flagellar biosynthetic protein FliQ
MTPEFVLEFTRHALTTAMLVAAPVLLSGLVVGLAVAVFQAVTQIHEVTLTFIPKIIVMSAVAFFTAGWMLEHLIDFAHKAFTHVAGMGA